VTGLDYLETWRNYLCLSFWYDEHSDVMLFQKQTGPPQFHIAVRVGILRAEVFAAVVYQVRLNRLAAMFYWIYTT
jgi:hypothetical protein